jgi:hypothetical protein
MRSKVGRDRMKNGTREAATEQIVEARHEPEREE